MEKKEIFFRRRVLDAEAIAERMLSDIERYNNRRPHGWNKLDLAPAMRTFEATCIHIEEQLMAGRSVHIRGFATFAFRKTREDEDVADTRTKHDLRGRGGGGFAEPESNAIGFTPMFKLDAEMSSRTGIREKASMEDVPRFIGSIWSSRCKPCPPNPYVVGKAAGVPRDFASDVFLDFFLALVDTMVAGREIGIDFTFGKLHYDPDTKRVDFRFRKELINWVTNSEAKARESNRHAVGHRRHYENPDRVSDLWRYSQDLRMPRHEQLVHTKGLRVHRPLSATPRLEDANRGRNRRDARREGGGVAASSSRSEHHRRREESRYTSNTTREEMNATRVSSSSRRQQRPQTAHPASSRTHESVRGWERSSSAAGSSARSSSRGRHHEHW